VGGRGQRKGVLMKEQKHGSWVGTAYRGEPKTRPLQDRNKGRIMGSWEITKKKKKPNRRSLILAGKKQPKKKTG